MDLFLPLCLLPSPSPSLHYRSVSPTLFLSPFIFFFVGVDKWPCVRVCYVLFLCVLLLFHLSPCLRPPSRSLAISPILTAARALPLLLLLLWFRSPHLALCGASRVALPSSSLSRPQTVSSGQEEAKRNSNEREAAATPTKHK